MPKAPAPARDLEAGPYSMGGSHMKVRDVVLLDACRTAFAKAGEKGFFWKTRADDMVVKVIRELLRRNAQVEPHMVEENAWGATADPNPRFLAEKLVDPSALVMGSTAENLFDMFPEITKEQADRYALWSQRKAAQAIAQGKTARTIVPMSVYTAEGWVVADRDQQPRPDTTLEGLRDLRTPFRIQGKVTAGNSSGLNDGAAGCLLMSLEKARQLAVSPKMRMVSFAYAGVPPRGHGIGPHPCHQKSAWDRGAHHGADGDHRAERGLRRTVPRLHEGVRAGAGGSASQSLGRGYRLRTPLGGIRPEAHGPSHAPVPGDPQRQVWHDHHVRGTGAGRHGDLGVHAILSGLAPRKPSKGTQVKPCDGGKGTSKPAAIPSATGCPTDPKGEELLSWPSRSLDFTLTFTTPHGAG